MEFRKLNFSLFIAIFFTISLLFINLFQREWLDGGAFFIIFAIVGYLYLKINKLKSSYFYIQNNLNNLNTQKETFLTKIENFESKDFEDNDLTDEYKYVIDKINNIIDNIKEEIESKKPKVKTIKDDKKIKELKDKLVNLESDTLSDDLNLVVDVNENFEELSQMSSENEDLVIQLNEKIDSSFYIFSSLFSFS